MSTEFDPERFGKVTASRCSPLVPIKSAEAGIITLAKQLAKEKYFNFYDEASTWQTEHGNLAEPYAFEHYKKHYDADIKKGRWICQGETGCTTDAEGVNYGVDFKCPTSMDNWLNYLFKGIDSEQYNQCQLSMRLTGFVTWKIAAFLIETTRMSDNGETYPVDQKDRMIIVDVKADPVWNKKFDLNLPDLIKRRDYYVDILKKQFGQ